MFLRDKKVVSRIEIAHLFAKQFKSVNSNLLLTDPCDLLCDISLSQINLTKDDITSFRSHVDQSACVGSEGLLALFISYCWSHLADPLLLIINRSPNSGPFNMESNIYLSYFQKQQQTRYAKL